ncbi:MAG: hypothetical protein IKZ25_04140 [Clostridia bacterium]|nr:hypothetical protein [Clostridia bacterium]
MKKLLKNASFWGSILTLIYLILKNWFDIDIPGWNDIYTQIIALLSLIFRE